MRSVLVSVLALGLTSGCATVSMVPNMATVETNLTQEQSRLRDVSDAYIKQAKSEKWVVDDGGLWGFAKLLRDGASEDKTKQAYVQTKLDSSENAYEALGLIITDIELATSGLDVVTEEAKPLLASELDSKSLRADVMNFETVLVTAQKARRTFADAIEALDMAQSPRLYEAEDALTRFDTVIDGARDTADALAEASLQTQTNTATS